MRGLSSSGRLSRKAVAGLALALCTAAASAAPQWCAGKAPRVLVYANGELTIYSTWRGGWTALCNFNNDRFGVSPAVCRSWHAILLSAQAQGKDVIVQYDEAPSCESLPTYSAAPKPNYVLIEDTR